jgi:phosphoglycerate kinase
MSLSPLPAFHHQIIVVRVDWNVPFQNGKVLDQTRLEKTMPLLKQLLSGENKVVILSHRGRPKGVEADLSMGLLCQPVQAMLEHPVTFIPDHDFVKARETIDGAPWRSVMVLENIRFLPGEVKNDETLARDYASLGDVYINEGFSVSHRAHASVCAITRYLPSYPGVLFQEEVEALAQGFLKAEAPLMVIVGGSKISTKIELLKAFIHKASTLVVGGGIANTLLAAQGIEVGKSLVEREAFDLAKAILNEAAQAGCRIMLPTDVCVAPSLDRPDLARITPVTAIAPEEAIFDIGPGTIDLLKTLVEQSRTLLWNGPLGVFEIPPFEQGSVALATIVAGRTLSGHLYSLAGGGETVALLNASGAAPHLSFLSTAGGAFLEFLEGKTLPGISALSSGRLLYFN